MSADSSATISLAEAIIELDHTLTKIGSLMFFTVALFAVMAWWAIKIYENKTGEKADSFSINKADLLFETNELDSLLEYCAKFEKKFPNDVHVNWYFAIGHYNLGNLDRAKVHFEKVNSINPNWKNSTTGYIDEIDSTLLDSFNNMLQ